MTSPAFASDLERETKTSPWYHAATLKERLVAFSPTNADILLLTEEQIKRGTRRLAQWKSQTAFQDPVLFNERLEMDSITEQDLLHLLSEPIELVQQRITTATGIPTWLKELLQALECDMEGAVSLFSREGINGQGPVTLPNVFEPLIAPQWARLLQGIEQLTTTAEMLPFEPATVLDLFKDNLVLRLQSVVLRTVVLEMHVAHLQDRLSGETPQERFTDFLRQLCQRERLYALLQEYPVLARVLVTLISRWANFSLELLGHLCADWSEICAKLAGGKDPGMLVGVHIGAGDTHRDGRSVAILRFASGLQVVYKPRPLTLDQHFQELLAWINEQQATLPLRTLTILPRENYGWVEFVEVQDCTTEEEVGRFYERQGIYLALLYVLDAVDFHYENILAAGEHPVLVDLEALFHPRLFADEEEPVQSIGSSVMRTLLLPQRAYLQSEGEGLDLSGIGGRKGQFTPFPVLTWKESGTDRMRAVREQQELPGGQNRPKLQGQDMDVLPYESSFLKGFTETYRLLMARRTELLTDILPGFAHDEIRVILRPTRTYALLLTESFHPQYLCNALERERLFDHLWDNVAYQPALRRVIPAEREDLLQGDIPMFTTQPGSRDGMSSRGEYVGDICAQSSMEYVRKRVQQMNEDDLARQAWVIKSSFATLLTESKSISRLSLIPPSNAEATGEQLVQAARMVGDRLKELTFTQEQGTNWLGIEFIKEIKGKMIWNLQPMNPLKLYDGIPGVALFLSYLGKITGDAQYTDLAQSALATVQESVNLLLHPDISLQAQPANAYPLGAYEGLGSLIYLFSQLGVLWHNASYIQKAEELLDLVDRCIEQDSRLDVAGGSAGCIASLLSLYHVAPSPQTLKVAIHCGEHVLTRLQGMLEEGSAQAGFAYGLAGIALNLLKLSAVSRDERFHQGALVAITYERSLFDSESRNWPHRLGQDEKDFAVAWSHGAPGIGLARLGSLVSLDDAATREEIAIALQTTRAQGFGLNHSLCHGDLGNLDVLLTANQVLGDESSRSEVAHLTTMLLESIQRQGWCTGVPLGRETPGLMTGLAGIGYELLRLAEPDLVPSVLLLAPPCLMHQMEGN